VSSILGAVLLTVVGMGLVFAALIVFWGVLHLIVRLTYRTTDGAPVATAGEPDRDRDLKRRAAIAGVAVALRLQSDEIPMPFPLPPPVVVSTWQSVMRARSLGERGSVR
jgi:Na+-transporting methylmalonyl-CoA/oxaloacetate decarboxylase gamma subunit